jgi:hypothetical protein
MRITSVLCGSVFFLCVCQSCFALSYARIDAQARVFAPYPNSDTEHIIIEDAPSGNASVAVDAFVEKDFTRYKVQDDKSTVSASYDLTRGEVKFDLYASGDGADSFLNITLYDEIYPQWIVGTPGDQTIEVTLNWNMEGLYEISSGSLKNFTLQTGLLAELDTASAYDFDFTPNPSSTNLADGEESWSKTLLFDPAVNSHIGFELYINATLNTYTTQWAHADFANTGLLDIQLSEGATFTSSSGFLLTDAGDDLGPGPAPVPEPSTFILLGIGLAGLSICARRQKQG